MEKRKYEIRFTRFFQDDLIRVSDYITDVLGNPAAALRLVEETEKAVFARAERAASFEPYPESKSRKDPYYRILCCHGWRDGGSPLFVQREGFTQSAIIRYRSAQHCFSSF